jgi:hypothetical protein
MQLRDEQVARALRVSEELGVASKSASEIGR